MRRRKRQLKEWKPKRFPRLETPIAVLKPASEILRVTWNRIECEKRRTEHVTDVFKQKHRGLRAQHYFPIIADTLIRNKIGLALYLRVLSEYGFYGKRRIMPDPIWLAGPKALEVFGWFSEKLRRMHPGEENWQEFKKFEEHFDKRPSADRIEAEVLHSAKHLHKFVELHRIQVGAAAVFEWEKLSPWFLVLCEPFAEMQGVEFVNREMRTRLRAADKFYDENEKVRRRVKERIKAFSVLSN